MNFGYESSSGGMLIKLDKEIIIRVKKSRPTEHCKVNMDSNHLLCSIMFQYYTGKLPLNTYHRSSATHLYVLCGKLLILTRTKEDDTTTNIQMCE